MNLEEMWKRLAQHQPFADRRGYGPEWATMCAERTEEAAWAAKSAAKSASEADEAASVSASAAAWALMLVSEEAKAEAAREADEAVRWVSRSEEQK